MHPQALQTPPCERYDIMNEAIIQGLVGADVLSDVLPTANWDLETLLKNAGSYAKNVGGALLILMGIVGLVWGGTLTIKKLMSSQQDNTSWGKIILLLIIGGALAVGGFNLVFMVGSGGEKTIKDLGKGGVILLDSISTVHFGKPLGLMDLALAA